MIRARVKQKETCLESRIQDPTPTRIYEAKVQYTVVNERNQQTAPPHNNPNNSHSS